MRIPSFEVRSQRSVGLARCEEVPQLMVFAGPNGSGKSTVLNHLRTRATDNQGPVIYVPPHQYVAEIDRLERQDNISSTEHHALRYSLQARNELMNLTLGSEEEFSAR
jgi:predicted ABC-type ATPase